MGGSGSMDTDRCRAGKTGALTTLRCRRIQRWMRVVVTETAHSFLSADSAPYFRLNSEWRSLAFGPSELLAAFQRFLAECS